MKKFLLTLLALVALGALVFFALQSRQALEEPINERYETLEGSFKSLGGVRVNRSITHLFEEEDGTIHYTFSERYDLDDPRYTDGLWEVYGVLRSYESLDKEVLEVRRLKELEADENEETSVEMVSYQNPSLGVYFDHPNNWTVQELADAVILSAPLENPLKKDEAGAGDDLELISGFPEQSVTPSTLVVTKLSGISLNSLADAESSVKMSEIQSILTGKREDLSTLTAQSSLIGPDKLFAVKYSSGEARETSHYFIPRGSTLIELQFNPSPDESQPILDHANVFARMVSSFRFQAGASSQPSIQIDEFDRIPETSVSDAEQVSFRSYASFSSNGYAFTGSYPAPWYYLGRNGGYDFSTGDLELGAETVIRLDVGTQNELGSKQVGGKQVITVEVNKRRYTFTGPLEYREVMQTMAASLKAKDL